MTITDILAAKREEIARLRLKPVTRRRTRRRHSFFDALGHAELSIIAEIKRSSPSTGDLNVDIDLLFGAYKDAGVDALSILTDRHFGMTEDDLERLGRETDLPILRKDFILSREQIDEADAIGADAVLLIAKFLTIEELIDLGAHAESLGLDVLYEAHSREDLLKIPGRAKIIGINNRDLSRDYATDTGLSSEMVSLLPDGVLRVAESGFERAGEVPAGYDAALIGTGLIREFHRSGSVRGLVSDIKARYIR